MRYKKEGMALHYHMNFDDCELYDRIQERIRQDKKGLWTQGKVEKPWEYRRRIKAASFRNK